MDLGGLMPGRVLQEVEDNKLLAKVALGIAGVALTVFASIAVWVVKETIDNREFRVSGERFTREDATELRMEWNTKFSALPEKAEFSAMRADMQRISQELTKLQVVLERIDKRM